MRYAFLVLCGFVFVQLACTYGSESINANSNRVSGADLTASGTIVALITSPTGGGNHNLEVIRDNVFPPQGSTDSFQQYDTYTGVTSRANDWIGYTFSSVQTFGSVVFETGMQFNNGGWFSSVAVQVRQNSTWVNVSGSVISPTFGAHDGINYKTYTFNFPAVVGDGIRIYGVPGGTNKFISVGELRVYAAVVNCGSAGAGGTAGSSGSAGSAGTVAGAGGTVAGMGGSTSGSGGTVAGMGGSTAGSAGSIAGMGGSSAGSAGMGGSSAGTSGSSGMAGSGGFSGTAGSGGSFAGPYVRQIKSWALGDDNPAVSDLTFTQNVLSGSSIVVMVDDENFNGDPIGSGTPYPVYVTDSSNLAYTEILSLDDAADWDAVQVFLRKNITDGPINVHTQWTTNQWHAVVAIEIANVGTNPVVNSVGFTNVGVPQTTDLVTSGTLSLGNSPALIVGFAANFRDVAGDVGAPYAGTGFTPLSTMWNWNGKEGTSLNDSALLESMYSTNPGTIAAKFTASPSYQFNDTVSAIMVSFQ